MYSTDLAYIHDVGFGELAERAGPEAIRILGTRGLRRGLLVEVGCGSGTLARHLVDAGYDIVGFDNLAGDDPPCESEGAPTISH